MSDANMADCQQPGLNPAAGSDPKLRRRGVSGKCHWHAGGRTTANSYAEGAGDQAMGAKARARSLASLGEGDGTSGKCARRTAIQAPGLG